MAKRLAEFIGADVRFCGEEIKKYATQMKLNPIRLNLEHHKSIDEKTLEFAKSALKNIVIEGTYLRYVLINLKDVMWVELTCDDNVRSKRYLTGGVNDRNGIGIESRDFNDEVLRQKLYGVNMPDAVSQITIETSDKSVEDIVFLITDRLKVLDDN